MKAGVHPGMDPSQPAPPPRRPRRFHLGIIIGTLAVVIVTILGVSTASRKAATEPNFVWLDPAQFARQRRPGRLKILYYKALNLSAPLWQRFRRPKTPIQIVTRIFAVHGVRAEQLDLGTPRGTNAASGQVWILSASDLEALQQRFKNLDGIDLVSAPTILVGDGTSASLFNGQSLPAPLGFVGVAVDVNPKIASHQMHVAMSAVYSEVDQNKGSSPIRTNLCAACRVRMPNAGGLLIKAPDPQANNGTNYWFLLCPTAIDATGNPIKL